MKIFVCIKQVPDTETKIKIRADGNGIDTTGVKWVINPYDEFAIEEAIKMRDAGGATNVTVMSVGPKARIVEALRTALAMGADDAIAVDASDDLDSTAVAKALAATIKAEGDFKMVLTGKLAIDDNAAAVSQMLAEALGIAHATVISKIDVADGVATVEREVEGGSKEILSVKLPAVIAANKGLNVPRYASLPGIMKAKRKVIKELTLDGLGLVGSAASAKIRYTSFQLPAEKPAAKILAGDIGAQAHELVSLLRNEAKVI